MLEAIELVVMAGACGLATGAAQVEGGDVVM